MGALFILQIELTSKDIDDTKQKRLYCFDDINKVSDKIEYIKKKYLIYDVVVYALQFNGKKLEHIFTLKDSDILIN